MFIGLLVAILQPYKINRCLHIFVDCRYPAAGVQNEQRPSIRLFNCEIVIMALVQCRCYVLSRFAEVATGRFTATSEAYTIGVTLQSQTIRSNGDQSAFMGRRDR